MDKQERENNSINNEIQIKEEVIGHDIILDFPLTEDLLADIDMDKNYSGAQEKSQEDFEYHLSVSDKYVAFIDEKLIEYKNDSIFGDWVLVNSDNEPVENYNSGLYWQISLFEGYDNVNIRSQSLVSVIYTDPTSNNLYFFSPQVNLARQMKFIDDRLYIYTLWDNKWKLDKIHEGGKYYFKKR